MLCFEDPLEAVGGLGVHVKNLANSLSDNGHDVTILSYSAEYNKDGTEIKIESTNNKIIFIQFNMLLM